MVRRLLLLSFSFSLLFVFSAFTPDPVKPSKEQLRTIIIDAGHGLPNRNAEGRYSYESQLTLDMAMKIGARLKEVLPECNILFTRTDENLPNGLTDLNKANRYRAQFANDNHGDLFISIHVNSMADRYERRIEGYRQETYMATIGKGKKRKKVQKTRTVPIYKSYKLPCNRQGTETYIWAINKNDQKMQSIANRETDEITGEQVDSSFMDSPDFKILASLRTKKFFDKSLMMANYVEDEFKKVGRRSEGVKQRNHAGIWVLQATNMPSILVETGFICNEEEEDYMNSEKGQNEISYAVMRAVLRYKQSLDTGFQSTTVAETLSAP